MKKGKNNIIVLFITTHQFWATNLTYSGLTTSHIIQISIKIFHQIKALYSVGDRWQECCPYCCYCRMYLVSPTRSEIRRSNYPESLLWSEAQCDPYMHLCDVLFCSFTINGAKPFDSLTSTRLITILMLQLNLAVHLQRRLKQVFWYSKEWRDLPWPRVYNPVLKIHGCLQVTIVRSLSHLSSNPCGVQEYYCCYMKHVVSVGGGQL